MPCQIHSTIQRPEIEDGMLPIAFAGQPNPVGTSAHSRVTTQPSEVETVTEHTVTQTSVSLQDEGEALHAPKRLKRASAEDELLDAIEDLRARTKLNYPSQEDKLKEYKEKKAEFDALKPYENYTRWVEQQRRGKTHYCYITQVECSAEKGSRKTKVLMQVCSHTFALAKEAIALAKKMKELYGLERRKEKMMKKKLALMENQTRYEQKLQTYGRTSDSERDVIMDHIKRASERFGDRVTFHFLVDGCKADAVIRFEDIGMPEGMFLLLQYKTTSKKISGHGCHFSCVYRAYYQGMIIACVYKAPCEADELIWCLETKKLPINPKTKENSSLAIYPDRRTGEFHGRNVQGETPYKLDGFLDRLRDECRFAVENPLESTLKFKTFDSANSDFTSFTVFTEHASIRWFFDRIQQGVASLGLPDSTVKPRYNSVQNGVIDVEFHVTLKPGDLPIVVNTQFKSSQVTTCKLARSCGSIGGTRKYAATYREGENELYIFVKLHDDPILKGTSEAVWIFEESCLVKQGFVLPLRSEALCADKTSFCVHKLAEHDLAFDKAKITVREHWTRPHHCPYPEQLVQRILAAARRKAADALAQ